MSDDAAPETQKEQQFERRYGTRHEVWEGMAKQTRGGLTKDKLIISRSGRIVSKLKSEQARAAFKKYGFKKREPVTKAVKPRKRRVRKKKQTE